jgi:hypothetical protein
LAPPSYKARGEKESNASSHKANTVVFSGVTFLHQKYSSNENKPFNEFRR